jgi:GxxExxY protein
MEINDITGQIIDASIKIHKELGPGLPESVYEEILHYELTKRGLLSERQVPIPVYYDNIKWKLASEQTFELKKKYW